MSRIEEVHYNGAVTDLVSGGRARASAVGDGNPGAEAWALLFELFMAHKTRFPAIASEFDLTPQQAFVLHRLEPGTPVTMHALAQTLACDASNVTGLVDRLEARGLVERRGDEHDRRVKILAVTDEGVAVRDSLRARVFSPPPPIAALSRADQLALREILRRALDAAPQ